MSRYPILATSFVVLALSLTGLTALFYGDVQQLGHYPYRAALVAELMLLTGVSGTLWAAQRSARRPLNPEGLSPQVDCAVQAEHGLRQSEAKYRSIYEQAAVGISYANEQGELLGCNRKLAHMLGYCLGELTGKRIEDISHPRTRERHSLLLSLLLAGEIGSFSMERRYLRKDGTAFWGSTTVSLFIVDEDGPQCILGVTKDINQRKRCEAKRQRAEAERRRAKQQLQQLNRDLEARVAERTQALKQSEARLQLALDGAGDGVWDWNIQASSIFFSQKWKEMLGYAEDEIKYVIGEWNKRIHPDDRVRSYTDIGRHFSGETDSYRNEHRLRCKDGSYKWILARGKLIERTTDGMPLRMVGTHSDISERKQHEAERRRLEAEQQQAEQQLQTLVEATASATEQDFFPALVQHVAEALDVSHAVVSEQLDTRHRTLAFWADGALQSSVIYDVAGTPCEQTVTCGRFYCDRGLWQRFPDDAHLADICAESYLGIALFGSDGAAIGTLCVFDRRSLGSPQRATDILQIFAARAAAELERQRARVALEQLNLKLEARVEARTAELQEQKQFLQTVLDTFPLSVFWKDQDLFYQGGNLNFLRDVGLPSVAELVGKTDYDLPLQEAEIKASRARDVEVMGSNTAKLEVEELLLGADRRPRWVETNKLPLHNLSGKVVGVLGTYQDITARKTAEMALQESEARLRLITDAVHACISYTDASQRYRFVNRSYEVWFDRPKTSILGRTVAELIGQDAYRQVQPYIKRALAGETVTYEMDLLYRGRQARYISAVLVPNVDAQGEVHGYYALIHDISNLKRTQQQIVHDAQHDSLTGLPNRIMLTQQLERAIAYAKQTDHYCCAVLFLDLDRFKVINDSLGHAVGDQLLVAIASRLRACLRETDFVARLGGDEFVILLEEVSDTETVVQIIDCIITDVQMPLTIEGHEVFAGVSVGVVMCSATYKQPTDLIRDADIAMYRAKAQGGNRYEFFDTTMHTRIVKRLALETDLRRAINQREFVVHYQPIVNLADLELVGFEALIRWQHPRRQLVSPDEFVPMAEEMGVISVLDSWIFQDACQQMSRWRTTFANTDILRISINLSVQDLRRPSLVHDIDAVLSEAELPASAITLEITESLLIDDIHSTVETLSLLVSHGIRISIDDFGTGYSSLSYLHRLPIHYLKIDSSFIRLMEPNNRHYQVVDTIITLSDRLGLTPVAEGIETTDQLQQLQQLGCRLGQGYLVSEAITPLEVEAQFLSRP
ncbi:MAG: EAL domain-containing protein [Elainellaceae cyanobacterium]